MRMKTGKIFMTLSILLFLFAAACSETPREQCYKKKQCDMAVSKCFMLNYAGNACQENLSALKLFCQPVILIAMCGDEQNYCEKKCNESNPL